MNRMSQRFVNEKGRTTSVVNPDIEPVSFSYRTDGRVETVRQGTGTEERALTVSYYDHTDETTGALKGEVSTILDPEMHTVDFEYDLMGRVTRKIFEKNTIDQRIVEYVYDASGNVLAITPAGRPAHNFYYDSVDLPYVYDAPEVSELIIRTKK
jgi:YD repeat-containing protein